MTLDKLIEELQEVQKITSGATPVFVSQDIVVNGQLLEDMEQIVTEVECFSKIKGGDEVIIKGSSNE